MKSLPPSSRSPQNLILSQYSEEFCQQLKRKIAAFEGFVNLNALA
jgi:hypothetical protein